MELIKKTFYNPLKNNWIEQSGLDENVFNKEVSFAIQHFTKNTYLQKCSAESALKAVMNIAQTGLTLNPVSKYAYLIPRYNSQLKTLECVLDPSYMGLVKLLTDSGSVKHIEAQIIYEGDLIDVDYASTEKVKKHIPYFLNGKEKGKILAVYSIATLQDDNRHIEIMSKMDIEEIRERSESYKAYKSKKAKSSIWVSDESEMFRKTVIKRHFKYLPKTNKVEQIQKAIDLDHIAAGNQEPVNVSSLGYIETLISQGTNLSNEEIAFYTNQLSELNYEFEAKRLIKELSNKKLNPGQETDLNSMKEVNKALENRLEREN